MMAEGLLERLAQLEEAVRRAADAVARLRDENVQLKREVKRLGDERRQVLGQVDAILKDIARLDLDGEASAR
jgi:cell division protein FtsB